MKLDPEERIIAAALDQAVLNPANDRGAGAQIEISREGRQGAATSASRQGARGRRTLFSGSERPADWMKR